MSNFEVLESYISLRREVALLRAFETKNLDFGHNQVSVLYKLSQGPATMGELSDYTLSDKGSMTRTVNLLEKAGFVRRSQSPGDRRVIVIELTTQGKTLARKSQQIRNAIGRRLDEALSEKERKQFSSLVHKIVSSLKK
jgi:DNA-binding MarR family transcriptional regulator